MKRGALSAKIADLPNVVKFLIWGFRV